MDISEKIKQLDKLAKGSDIQLILNSAYKILGHPIAMFDTNYRLLCYTENIKTDDWPWNELIAQKGFSFETVKFFHRENFIESSFEPDVSIMRSANLKYDRIHGKIFDRSGTQIGNIIVVCCHTALQDGDEKLVEHFCEILTEKVLSSEYYTKIEKIYERTLLNDLIDGTLTGNHAKEAVRDFYNKLKSNIYLAVIDISNFDHTITHLGYLRDVFRKIQPEYKYFIHLNYVIAIISIDSKFINISRDLNALDDFFAQNNIFAGLSSGFQDLRHIKDRYREGINALNYGIKGTRRQQIFSYDNFRIEHFINSKTFRSGLNNIINPIVTMMSAYDRENGTRHASNLYNYLLYGMDIDEAVRATNTPSSEFFEAIKRAENEYEVDFKNGNTIASLFISLKLLYY